MVALATALSYTSVKYVDPGTASLLGQTSTLFALLFGLFWLHENMSVGEWLGAGVTLLGAFIIGFQPGDYLRLGSLLVLGSAAIYALHAAVVKRFGGDIEFGNFFLFRIGSTTLFLLLLGAGGGALIWPGRVAWPFLLLGGTVDVVISRVLYYVALRRLRMSFHAILLTLSPVITVLWSLALFGERPSVQGLVGGTAVILGVIIVTRSKQKARNRLEKRGKSGL
ncbi:MAG: DMT family transporter, partial [Anaerolineales bacterium]|nr:DMT family transporter [Anaerolineales bacterium]